MRKLIAGMNMTLDGFCDHTVMIADAEIHDHYTEVLRNSGLLLYGRITYQLMESYWPMVVRNPTGDRSTDAFAVVMDEIPKIVYSRSLRKVDWKTATLRKEVVREEIVSLKQQSGKDILVGSPSLIVTLANLGLVDEFQLGVQPILAGKGLSLFKNLTERIDLNLLKTKRFGCGAVMLYLTPRPPLRKTEMG